VFSAAAQRTPLTPGPTARASIGMAAPSNVATNGLAIVRLVEQWLADVPIAAAVTSLVAQLCRLTLPLALLIDDVDQLPRATVELIFGPLLQPGLEHVHLAVSGRSRPARTCIRAQRPRQWRLAKHVCRGSIRERCVGHVSRRARRRSAARVHRPGHEQRRGGRARARRHSARLRGLNQIKSSISVPSCLDCGKESHGRNDIRFAQWHPNAQQRNPLSPEQTMSTTNTHISR
jgi:hypothetical protein